MRVPVELKPDSAEAARILGEWQAAWGVAVAGGDVELAPADSLAALLDLKERCYEQGVTINATFPDNLGGPTTSCHPGAIFSPRSTGEDRGPGLR